MINLELSKYEQVSLQGVDLILLLLKLIPKTILHLDQFLVVVIIVAILGVSGLKFCAIR